MQEIEERKSSLDQLTSSEQELFASEFPPILTSEKHLRTHLTAKAKSSGSTSQDEHHGGNTSTLIEIPESFVSDDGELESSVDMMMEMESSVDDSVESSVDGPDVETLPEWLKRPGAPKAVLIGADLRERYSKLLSRVVAVSDEGTQLLERVRSYESSYERLSDWLKEKGAAMKGYAPPSINLEELKGQLQEVQVCACMHVH